MSYQEDVLKVLRSMDATLKQLLARTTPGAGAPARQTPGPAAPTAKGTTAGGGVAPASDLDSAYGNPIVKFMPRDWKGRSFKGRKMSDCPPELLDCLAETFEYFAMQAEQKNELTPKGRPVADYKRLDAARARGWAKRSRAGALAMAPAGKAAAAPRSPAGRVLDDEWATTSEFD